MTLDDLNGILRAQAWERAKGELNAILVSYIGDRERFERMNEAVGEFIELVEVNGLAE